LLGLQKVFLISFVLVVVQTHIGQQIPDVEKLFGELLASAKKKAARLQVTGALPVYRCSTAEKHQALLLWLVKFFNLLTCVLIMSLINSLIQ